MNNYFASNFRHLRKQKGYTQEEIGKKLNKDYSAIGKWEKGINSPIMEDIFKIAQIFNVDIVDLLNRDLITKNTEAFQADKGEVINIYTDPETGLTVQLIPTDKPWKEYTPEEQKQYIDSAMDALYEYKRNMKYNDKP